MPDTALSPNSSADAMAAKLRYNVFTGVKPVNETFGPANMTRRVQGKTEEKDVLMHDGRALKGQFDLEVQGFEFVDHDTQVKNFLDEHELKSVYYPECVALIKKVSGASRVHVFDHTLRSGNEDERNTKYLREPVLSVHNDYTEWSGPQRVRDLLPQEAEKLIAKRFAIIQVWRPISSYPVEADPLAIADARSLDMKDLIAAERRYPDRVGETYQIKYNPEHHWYWFPKWRRDEALVFKVYESKKDGRARFTAHSAFKDPTSPANARPRQSIEIRTLAFFDEDN
jgi:hypothetical protein